MTEKITRWMCGTACVRVFGDTARFIRVMVRSGIYPLAMTPEEQSVQILVRAKQFKRLHTVKRRTHTRVKLLRKSGLPFLLHRVWRRPGFTVGLALGVCLYIWLSGFYWCVEVVGEAPYAKTEILAAAKERAPSATRKKPSSRKIFQSCFQFLLNLPQLSLLAMKVKGSIRIAPRVTRSHAPHHSSTLSAPEDLKIRRNTG